MAITQVDFIDAQSNSLRQDDPSGEGEGVRFAKNHSSASDGGGGIFEWDASSTLDDNNGTIIQVTGVSTGRWIRQVDVRGAVQPEWWGVTGDGTTADYNRLKKCFESIRVATVYPKKPKVVFLAKTYLIKGELLYSQYVFVLDLEEGEVLEGQGIDRTILAACTDDGVSRHKIAVIRGGRAEGAEQDNIVIRDLTIDCGFSQSSTQRTREAIELYGQSNIVERVKAINFGVGWDNDHQGSDDRPGECFPIFLSTLTEGGRIGIIRDCEVTTPGFHDSAHTGYHWPEITALTVMGRGKIEDPPGSGNYRAVVGIGGAIVGNRVHDIPYNQGDSSRPYQPSAPHAITVASCIGTEVADNEVINCDGVGVYVVSWTDENVVIRNNRLLGVNCGVHVGVASSEVESSPPSHTGTRITANVIEVGKNTHISPGAGAAGVLLTVDTDVSPSTIRLKDITIARNFVRAQIIDDQNGVGTVYPQGVRLWLLAKAFENIAVVDNTLEVPAAQPEVDYAFDVPYENAVTFIPHYLYVDHEDVRRTIRLHNNRNLAGSVMRLKTYEFTPMKSWGPFSTRLQRFRGPLFDGPARVYYDEFLGQLPRAALGWIAEPSGTGSGVSAGSPESDKPGVVTLSTGTAINGYSRLKYLSSSITLGGGRSHVVQWSTKRSQSSSYPKLFRCRFGLLDLAEPACGLYFRIQGSGDETINNRFLAVAAAKVGDTVQEEIVAGTGQEFSTDWHTFRVEIAKDASYATFFADGKTLGVAKTYVPTSALQVMLCIENISAQYHGQNHELFVDYFQHIIS